ncbi:hypothetical protein DFH11DRAFT_964204 [Phellopilus nigrolimitatus]|nr:hypothetical protein DFH11DRAFT_964204 [Phellopilus nigrolimitatus]
MQSACVLPFEGTKKNPLHSGTYMYVPRGVNSSRPSGMRIPTLSYRAGCSSRVVQTTRHSEQICYVQNAAWHFPGDQSNSLARGERGVLIFLPRNADAAFLSSDDRFLELARSWKPPWSAGEDSSGSVRCLDRAAHPSDRNVFGAVSVRSELVLSAA